MAFSVRQITYAFIIIAFILASCNRRLTNVSKIEMHLSSFGVESDNYPSINAFISLKSDSSSCHKFYYSTGHMDSTYTLTKIEIEKIKDLISHVDMEKLKKNYKVNKSDQATSTMKFYTDKEVIVIEDYGLKGDYPLQDLYQIVYKF